MYGDITNESPYECCASPAILCLLCTRTCSHTAQGHGPDLLHFPPVELDLHNHHCCLLDNQTPQHVLPSFDDEGRRCLQDRRPRSSRVYDVPASPKALGRPSLGQKQIRWHKLY